MNRSLLVLGITLAAALPARADLTHKIQSSVQLEVGGASTRAVRWQQLQHQRFRRQQPLQVALLLAMLLAVLGAHTNGVGALTPSRFQTQPDCWQLIQLCKQLHRQGDTIPTSAPTVGAVPAFGDVTSTAAAVNTGTWLARSPQQALSRSHLVEPIPRAIGQVISELTTR